MTLELALREEGKLRLHAEACMQEVCDDVSAAARTLEDVKGWQAECRRAILDAVTEMAKVEFLDVVNAELAELPQKVRPHTPNWPLICQSLHR